MADYRNLKEKAYTIIKSKILNNELKPNQYLEEKMQCEELEISRTPIREGIKLAWEDLVRIIPKKGIFLINIPV